MNSTEITTGIQYKNVNGGWTTLEPDGILWEYIGNPKQFRYGITSNDTTVYEYEEVTVINDGRGIKTTTIAYAVTDSLVNPADIQTWYP